MKLHEKGEILLSWVSPFTIELLLSSLILSSQNDPRPLHSLMYFSY